MPAWIPTAIGAAAGLFSSILGNKNEQKAHQRDRAEALEDWNRNNDYNSPKAQMQRFKDAGLNPQLIYGQGTPGNAPATPVSQQKSGNPSYKPDLQQIYGEAQRLSMNMQQTQQTVENLKTNQELLQANIELQNQTKDIREKKLPFELDKADATINSLNTQSQWRNNLLEPTLRNLDTKTDFTAEKNKREERWLTSQLSLNSSRNEQIQAQTALTVQMRAKAIEDTINKRVTNQYQRSFIIESLRKLSAEADNVIQSRKTSMSVEQLNKINAELRDWQNTYYPVTESVNILQRILSPFKKQ